MKFSIDLPKARLLKATLISLAVLLVAVPTGYAQNTPDVNTMPLDQLARAIANTIQAGAVRTPNAPLTFDEASADGTRVILHFTVQDTSLLSKMKAGSDHMRETMASHYCRNPQSAASLSRGISLVSLYELADKSDQVRLTVDAAACASLANVKPASASELARMAKEVASVLRSDEEKNQQKQQGVELKDVKATGEIVEPRFVVVAPAFDSFYRANLPQTQAMLKGYVCQRFGDSVRRGLHLHLVYDEPNTGAILSEINVGPSDC